MSSPGELDTIIWKKIEGEGKWKPRETNFENSLTERDNFLFPSPEERSSQLVLVNRDVEYPNPLSDKFRSLLKRFDAPEQLLVDEIYLRSNGYFGENSSYQAGCSDLITLSTWFRFEIKFIGEKAKLQSKVEKAKKPSKTEEPIPDDYTWHKIICLTHWSAKQNIVFCIATMIAFEHFKASFDFEDLLAPSRLSLDLSRPYAAHALISREIVYLFDDSVWGMRDLTRTAEKLRKEAWEYKKISQLSENFGNLHEGTRHTVHSSETLNAAIKIVTRIQQQQAKLSEKSKSKSPEETQLSSGFYQEDEKAAEFLEFQLCKLQNLLLRSQANHERLCNEVSLTYNLLAVTDTNNLVNLAGISERDSAAMKTISVVTMMFFPSTFLATIFSSSFFNFGDVDNSLTWRVSHRFWIYWVWAVPLTGLVFIWATRKRLWGGNSNQGENGVKKKVKDCEA